MKSKTSALLILCILLIYSCAPKEIYQSLWKPTPVKVDGFAKEWEVPLRYYDNDTRLNYIIANDKENFYVCIRATEEQTQMKILRAGLQLWIDTTGKKNQQIGVLFPVPNKENGLEVGGQRRRSAQPEIEQSAKTDVNRFHKRLVASANEMQLFGFKSPLGGIMPISNSYGVKAAINWDSSGVMIYELVIPFKTFYRNNLIDKDTLKTIGFCARVNAMVTPKRNTGSSSVEDNENAGGRGLGMRGGMGGMTGGSMGGGMRGGGMGGGGMRNNEGRERSALFEPNTFWIKFHLSVK